MAVTKKNQSFPNIIQTPAAMKRTPPPIFKALGLMYLDKSVPAVTPINVEVTRANDAAAKMVKGDLALAEKEMTPN